MPLPVSHRARRLLLSAIGSVALAGCTQHRPTIQTATTQNSASTLAARPIDPKASLALNEIAPVPVLAAPPAAASHEQAPLDALMLYAKARFDEQGDQRYAAISQLEQAARIDPNSFDIQSELARLYLSINSAGDQAESALAKAAELKPDDLQTQTDLGRVYLSRGDLAKATEHLRLATETTEYRNYADEAAITDYYLAQSLQKQGYDRAALDSYTKLLKRLQDAPDSVRGNPEIQYWLSRPELLYAEVGRLREKQGDPGAALAAYRVVAERSPDDMETRQHMVALLMQMNHRDDAARLAIESIVRTHASRQSLDMLREVFRGDDERAVAALQRLSDQHPQDRTVLFALSDMLVANGQPDRATQTLAKIAATTRDDKGAGDTQVVGKLFHLLADQGKTSEAAKLLIQTSADRPDSATELLPYWIELTGATRAHRLHPAEIQASTVERDAEAARSYWVARLAVGRPELLKSSLADAIAHQPPFRPAYRFAISQILGDSTLPSPARQQQINALVASVEKNDPALSQELLAIALVSSAANSARSGDKTSASELANAAIGAFENARKQGDIGPDVQSELADAELLKPDAAAYERIMWKLIADRPNNESAYTELFHYYQDIGQAERAVAVSQTWLMSDPNNPRAQLLHIVLLSKAGVKEEAARAITDLYNAHPEDSQVIDILQQLLSRPAGEGGSDAFMKVLEGRVGKHPGDLLAVGQLVTQYVQQKRIGEAVHLIDNARAAVAHDADQLYYVAHLYDLTAPPGDHGAGPGQSPTEQTLLMALKVDPDNAGANNDLGYEWADAGRNLSDAESLIRRAIDLEPDNGAYLDSLGWVLYKRGKFDDSRQYLEKAVQPAAEADPVVLDHLGDDLYRLNQNADARQRWQDSLNRLDERLKRQQEDAANGVAANLPGDELGLLKLQLQQKLKQVDQGTPVNVAPVTESNMKQVRATSR